MTVRKSPPPYGTVVFDCDSTLSTIEGIEALAEGREEEIRALTELAMSGEVPLESVYGKRLEAIRPSVVDTAGLAQRYLDGLVPHVAELIAALRFVNVRVCIVSGGLLQPVVALAREIGVDPREVDAVAIFHDTDGEYRGFDQESPLVRAGGKLEVVREIATGPGARPPVALVGDGATDLEASPACARFVAFGGVVHRDPVFAAADVGCDAPDAAALLPLLCSREQVARLERHPQHAQLVEAARALSS